MLRRAGIVASLVFLSSIFSFSQSVVAATVSYVDPDWTGDQTGAAATPWTSLTASAWTTINTALATDDVTIYFSARNASIDKDETTTTQLQLKRTDTGTHRLTLDGMSQYNTNDANPSWAMYSGSSRFQHNISVTGADALVGYLVAPTLQSYITVRGFRFFAADGKAVNYWGGNHVIIEYNEMKHTAHTSDNSGLLIQYARKVGQTEVPCVPNDQHNCGVTDVIIRNNIIHNTNGECIYIGGTENTNFTAHSNILIENNTLYNCGQSAGGEDNKIDIKDGSTGVTIRGNELYDTRTPLAIGASIVAMSHVVIERNFIHSSPGAAISLSVTWNTYNIGNRDGSSIRNNIIASMLASPTGPSANYTYGVVADGLSTGDNWTNLDISNNTIYHVATTNGGDGLGIVVTQYATPTSVQNNVVSQDATGKQPFTAKAGSLGTHSNNDYYWAGAGAGATIATYGGNSYTAATITSFESESLSVAPLFTSTAAPYTSAGFGPQVLSPVLTKAVVLSSFNNDFYGVIRGLLWDMGAAQITNSNSNRSPPRAPSNLRVSGLELNRFRGGFTAFGVTPAMALVSHTP